MKSTRIKETNFNNNKKQIRKSCTHIYTHTQKKNSDRKKSKISKANDVRI